MAVALFLIASGGALPAASVQVAGGGSDSLSGITIEPAVLVSADDAHGTYVESFLAVNPRDDDNLIATAITATNGHFHSVAYASFDGGRSWSRGRGPEHDLPFRAHWSDVDPVVYFDDKGTAFFGRLILSSSPSLSDSVVLLSRSRDGGRTWDRGIMIPVIRDREYFAFDRSGGQFRGRMYAVGMARATWLDGSRRRAIAIAHSDDGGRAFQGWHILLPQGEGKSDIWCTATPVVTPSGALVIPYLVFDAESEASAPSDARSGDSAEIRHGYFMTVVSTDGGESFSAARRGPTADAAASPQQFLASLAAPSAAVDNSEGQYRGRIYLAWTDYADGRYNVRVAYSNDTARIWSPPVTVNDSSPAGGDPATPAITVNKYGVVGVVWNDRRHDQTNRCYQRYFAASLDGGATFGRNIRLSAGATCPEDATSDAIGTIVAHRLTGDHCCTTEIALVAMQTRWPNGGDTQGLVADSAGIFHVAGIEANSASPQLIAQRVAVTSRPRATFVPHAGQSDLSETLTLEVTDANVDSVARTATIRLRVVNTGDATVHGPFTVLLDEFDSRLIGAHVTNADNGLAGHGAIWHFTTGGTSGLAPGAKSNERVIVLRFTTTPHDIRSSLLHARFRIFGGDRNN